MLIGDNKQPLCKSYLKRTDTHWVEVGGSLTCGKCIKYQEGKMVPKDAYKFNSTSGQPRSVTPINRDYKRKVSPLTKGCVYLIKAEGIERYKVGYTASDVRARFLDLSVGSPVELTLIGFIESESPLELEKSFHRMFRPFWARGEWFDLPAKAVEMFKSFSGYRDVAL